MFHWRYTSAGGVTKDTIFPVVSISLEIYLCWWSHPDIIRPVFSVSLEIYLCWWSNRGYHPPLVESSRIRPVVSVSLEIYLCWWSHRGYHPPSSQCFTGDIPLLVESSALYEDIIRPVVSVSLEIYFCWRSHRGYHPPLVESSRIRQVGSVSLEIYLCWWSHRGYHPPNGQCFTGDIPLLVESPRISSAQYSVFHWRYTSAGGVTEDIIRPVVSV